MMVRTLSKQLQKKAIEELHEVPDRIEEDIQHIQEWIKLQPHLNAPTDKQWILGFLRGCKFSLQTTKEKFDMYYTAKNLIPELLKPKDTFSIEIQTLLKAGIVLPLPYYKDYHGPRVILFRFNNYTGTGMANIESLTVLLFMIMNILMIEDDNSIVSGFLFWVDMVHYPLSIVFQLTPTYLKNFFHSLQHAFPLRIKGIHATGSPSLAEKLFNLMRGYMGPKLKDRIFVYSENKFENMFKSVPKKCMPKEYGGENSNVDEIRDNWIKQVESYSSWFEESNKYYTNEAKRPGKPASFDDIIGTDGSFRKLNLD